MVCHPGRIEGPAPDQTPGPGQYSSKRGEVGTDGPQIGMQGKAREAPVSDVPGPGYVSVVRVI